MEITRANVVPFEELRDRRFTAVLVAAGYEARARHVATRMGGTEANRRIALAFTDRTEEPERKENDRALLSLGYDAVQADGDDGEAPMRIMRELSAAHPDGRLDFLVDYSSMTRVWYSSIIRQAAALQRDVRVFLAYTPADYHEPPDPDLSFNEWMGPLDGFAHLKLPDRRIALVIGLGYEHGRALALAEYVDAWGDTYAFYTDPGSHPEYVKRVRDGNADLIRRLGPERVIAYPFDDLALTAALLNSTVSSLALGRRVILAPLGPKPFCMLSLILSMRESYVDVWRVSGGKRAPTIPRAPSRDGTVLLFEVGFAPEKVSRLSASGRP